MSEIFTNYEFETREYSDIKRSTIGFGERCYPYY